MKNNITEVVRNQFLQDAKLNRIQLSQEEMKNKMREIMERWKRSEEETRENIKIMAIKQEMEIMKIEELQETK